MCDEFAVDPSVPLESEEFFRILLASYSGPDDENARTTWLREQLAKQFRCVAERPKWIQSPAWPFANGVPMVFVGQLDIRNPAPAFLHDDTSFYVFISTYTAPKVVMQQY